MINVGRTIKAAQDAYRVGDATKQADALTLLFDGARNPAQLRNWNWFRGVEPHVDRAFEGAVHIARTMSHDERNALEVRRAASSVLEAMTSPSGAGAAGGQPMATWRLSESNHRATGDFVSHATTRASSNVRGKIDELRTATTNHVQWGDHDAALAQVLNADVPAGVRAAAVHLLDIGHDPDEALRIGAASFAELTQRTVEAITTGAPTPR